MNLQTKYFLDLEVKKYTKDLAENLSDEIQCHNNFYYNKQDPVISDYEYDMLLKKLHEVESFLGIHLESTEQVGAELIESTFNKVKHSRPMISLDNTYNEEDLNDFDERVGKHLGKKFDGAYTLEFKFDGLGVELIYKNGLLVQAITRGNGVEGEDITQNVFQIDNIPKQIAYKKHLEVRGEVVLPLSEFLAINEKAKIEGSKIFSNPRNAASGSLRTKDISITNQRNLKFFAYDLANFSDFCREEKKTSYYDVILDLEKFGFDISSYFIKCVSIQQVINEIDNFGDLKRTLDFEIDGLVLKVNDVSLWEEIGYTQHHPRYAIAYKFPAELITTKLLSVEHSVGRTGTITPVANLEPVIIGGVTVKRATLHNYDEIEKLDIKIGDTIFIKRAGEVIPKVVSVVKDLRTGVEQEIHIPKLCPSCSHEVLKDESKVRYYCSNRITCPAQVTEKFSYLVGKQALNIDGFGVKQVELFLEKGFMSDIPSIFSLYQKKHLLLELEGFQEKSVNKLLDSIEKVKDIDISKLLTSLQIPNVGKKTAKELSKLFQGPEDLLAFPYTQADLEKLNDIGGEIAHCVYVFFNDLDHKELLTKLVEIFNITYYNPGLSNSLPEGERSKLYEKKVCITGSFEDYKREELAKKLEEVGGEFMSSVSKKTDYLLAGEKAGSKLKKAQELGVEVLSLEDFLKLL